MYGAILQFGLADDRHRSCLVETLVVLHHADRYDLAQTQSRDPSIRRKVAMSTMPGSRPNPRVTDLPPRVHGAYVDHGENRAQRGRENGRGAKHLGTVQTEVVVAPLATWPEE